MITDLTRLALAAKLLLSQIKNMNNSSNIENVISITKIYGRAYKQKIDKELIMNLIYSR